MIMQCNPSRRRITVVVFCRFRWPVSVSFEGKILVARKWWVQLACARIIFSSVCCFFAWCLPL